MNQLRQHEYARLFLHDNRWTKAQWVPLTGRAARESVL